MKGKNMKDWIESLPQERQQCIAEGTARIAAEHMALQELRKSLGVSQNTLAELLDMEQANLSRTERGNDMYLSTLHRYVEALGGKLHILAALPDKPMVELSQLPGTVNK